MDEDKAEIMKNALILLLICCSYSSFAMEYNPNIAKIFGISEKKQYSEVLKNKYDTNNIPEVSAIEETLSKNLAIINMAISTSFDTRPEDSSLRSSSAKLSESEQARQRFYIHHKQKNIENLKKALKTQTIIYHSYTLGAIITLLEGALKREVTYPDDNKKVLTQIECINQTLWGLYQEMNIEEKPAIRENFYQNSSSSEALNMPNT